MKIEKRLNIKNKKIKPNIPNEKKLKRENV